MMMGDDERCRVDMRQGEETRRGEDIGRGETIKRLSTRTLRNV